MSLDVALWLGQDGLVNGAIYALLALSLVLVFSVTRVIFVAQGEFVALGGLTLAALQAGRTPGTFWLLCAAHGAVALRDGAAALRAGSARGFGRSLLFHLVHLALVNLGLLSFGAEGVRTRPLSEARLSLGSVAVPAQAAWVVLFSAGLMAALWLLSRRTLAGKALRAAAMNRVGARLSGIPVALAGRWSFALAALVGAASGVLISPITTLYYDTGFLIGLKGFVGAVIGGLASYPAAAAGALLVGLFEAGASFWASAWKEIIVFGLVVPVLLWRSVAARHVVEED